MSRPDDAAGWEAALARGGGVEVGYRRLRTRLLAVVAVLFVLGGVLVALTGDDTSDRVLGVTGALLAAVVAASLSRRVLAGSAVVVVTDSGVRSVPQGWMLPWSAVRGAFAQANRGNARVWLVVDPAWQEARLPTLGRAARARVAGNRRLFGGLEVTPLPFPLEVDEEAFAAWLGGRATAPPG